MTVLIWLKWKLRIVEMTSIDLFIELNKGRYFFCQGFISRTPVINRTLGEGIFIPLYWFHPLTNIQTFIWNSAYEITVTYFYLHRLQLLGCYLMRFTTLLNYHLTDWWWNANFCLFTWLLVFRFFITAIWNRKQMDSNSHWLWLLYFKQSD